jgi:dihydrofolate reductase
MTTFRSARGGIVATSMAGPGTGIRLGARCRFLLTPAAGACADVARAVLELKQGEGPKLLIQGSSELIHQLLPHRLIDEIQLLIYPLVLGKGKRVFGDVTNPAAFKLTRSTVSPNGVVIATYSLAGDVKTGSFALEEPTEAELERRKKLSR